MKVNDYKIIYYYSFNDECYLARIPDLPGCISDGKTIAEAITNVRELARDWIDITSDYGEDIPLPSCLEYPSGEELHINDVAAYILERLGDITTKFLQKLLYYCNAWSFGWYHKALFPESFEAWAGGPVNKGLFSKHQHMLIAQKNLFANDDVQELSKSQKEFVDLIVDLYDDFDPDVLGEMTHVEAPWTIARDGCPQGEKCTNVISEDSMIDYYGQAS